MGLEIRGAPDARTFDETGLSRGRLRGRGGPAGAGGGWTRVLPTAFEENIIFVTPKTTGGEGLKLLTDTGCGLFLLEPSARRLGLMNAAQPMKDGDQDLTIAPWPEFRADAWIPAPVQGGGQGVVVLPADGEAKSTADRGWDAMLGQGWSRDRVWTFDYPGKTLALHPFRITADYPGSKAFFEKA